MHMTRPIPREEDKAGGVVVRVRVRLYRGRRKKNARQESYGAERFIHSAVLPSLPFSLSSIGIWTSCSSSGETVQDKLFQG